MTKTKTEHVYTCTSHTAIHYEQVNNGPWVEVDRETTRFANACAPGETFKTSVAEEGM